MRTKCPVVGCKNEVKAYEGMRKDINGEYWCKNCQDEFDMISDWDFDND